MAVYVAHGLVLGQKHQFVLVIISCNCLFVALNVFMVQHTLILFPLSCCNLLIMLRHTVGDEAEKETHFSCFKNISSYLLTKLYPRCMKVSVYSAAAA
jgi:uncharacterized membrane protein